MAEITFTGNKKLKSIAAEFSEKFPYLYLRFWNNEGEHVHDWDLTHASIRGKKGADDLSTNASMLVGTFEKRYEEAFGCKIEVMYILNERRYRSLDDNNNQTLNEYKEWAKAKGADNINEKHSDFFA
jgi:hypothetical protein